MLELLLSSLQKPSCLKIQKLSKHLSTHTFIFSLGLALENVQNHFYGLETLQVMLKQLFALRKGQISSLPLASTGLAYLDTMASMRLVIHCLCTQSTFSTSRSLCWSTSQVCRTADPHQHLCLLQGDETQLLPGVDW